MLHRARSRLSAVTKSILPTTSVNTVSRRPIRMEATLSPLAGLYKPNQLQGLFYGPDCVKKNLLACLPSDQSKAFIITGQSLATKTPLIKDLENLLGTARHAGTFSNIREHAPVAQLDEATDQVLLDPHIDTIISVGGGSPIDSAKAISYRVNERSTSSSTAFLRHIAIPTTLSAAECTWLAGYTQANGVKTSIADPRTHASFILYDPKFALYTPPSLFITTGIRALDHAVELQYYPTATLMPAQMMARQAACDLFEYLPRYKADPADEQVITRLFLAAFASLGFLGANLKGSLGLSHTLGYAMGSPYGIPHGVTSCLSLGHVVKLKARLSDDDASQLAQLLPWVGGATTTMTTRPSGDTLRDAEEVGDRILKLVDHLGFKTTLTEKGVGRDQLDIIVDRATGGLSSKDGKSDKENTLVLEVRKLVESLY